MMIHIKLKLLPDGHIVLKSVCAGQQLRVEHVHVHPPLLMPLDAESDTVGDGDALSLAVSLADADSLMVSDADGGDPKLGEDVLVTLATGVVVLVRDDVGTGVLLC